MLKAAETVVYEFGEFRFHADNRRLFSLTTGELVPLQPKAAELLLFLLKNPGRVLTKNEILETVWNDNFVEESNLSQTIFVLRKALNETSKDPHLILTMPRQGYQFIAAVKEIHPEDKILDESILSRSRVGEAASSALHVPTSEIRTPQTKSQRPALIGLAIALVLLMALGAYWFYPRATSPASLSEIRTIAILPFKNIESNEDDQLLGIGMADAIITRLSRVKSLVVRQTNSVMRYAATTPEAIKVGREINVDAVLEGNIQRAEGRIRVTARLFRVSDGSLIWAESFDERDANIFALQDSISQKVASSLSLELSSSERDNLKRRYTDNVEAYNLYQKGRFFWNNRNGNDLRKSIELFNQAIDLDANYALAYSGLADSYVLLQFFSHTEKNDYFQKARDAAEKALSLDKDLAEPHAALAMYKQLFEWDWAGAESEFKLAIAANPSYATAHQWYGEFLTSMGRYDESIAELEKAVELDPLSLSTNTARAQPYLASGRYAEAIEKLKPAFELDRFFSLAWLYMGRAYDGLGNHKEALAQYQKNMKKRGDRGPYFTASIINSYVRNGQPREAEDELNGLLRLADKTPVSNYVLARGLAPLDHKNEALEKLERAVEQRDGLLIIMRTDRNFDNLRAEPRFQKILTDMKLNF